MRFIYLMFFSLIVISCNHHNTNNLIEILQNPEINTKGLNEYCEFLKMGKEIIPDLINSIDTDQKRIMGFHDPKSSTLLFSISNKFSL